ncbi:MAG: SDR family oxidoreductase [Chloroflexi bacterium]|jgi:NAD(P)-dependent dehydrogenase (short-subunit alcohol dehydrogenase family)|nr:SDR family oxidoreductase [Chloroflexota bacterium]
MGQLDGRRAIVTGGASGIGRATAELLAAEGAVVLVADIDLAGAEAAATVIRERGGQAMAVHCDVSRDEDNRRMVALATAELGGLDILVTCAGIARRTDVVESTEEEWDRVIGVNLKSVYLAAHHAIPVMAAGGGGAIVTIGSGWGVKGGDKAASYCASKGAVVNLTRAMAIDHGPQGIRVNCVCPGDTDTPMLRGEARQLGVDEGAFLASSADRPLARLGRPEDAAQAVLYLASDAAAWVTGAILVVDGGGIA